CQHSYVTPFTF
nr:immunoglobulin light chain junction region [Macaca mulatta]